MRARAEARALAHACDLGRTLCPAPHRPLPLRVSCTARGPIAARPPSPNGRLARARGAAQVPSEVVVADTTPPGLAPLTAAPAWAAPAAAAPGLCNAYLPDDSTLSRFLWTVDHLAQNGFYIVLDNQFNLDQTVLKDQALWLQRARRPALSPVPHRAKTGSAQLEWTSSQARMLCMRLERMLPRSGCAR